MPVVTKCNTIPGIRKFHHKGEIVLEKVVEQDKV